MNRPADHRPIVILRGLLFTVIGGIVLAIATRGAIGRVASLRHAQAADGIVEGLNAGGSHPQVAFTTASGERISYAQNGLVFGYREKQAVRVLYVPDDAKASATVDDLGALWGMTVLLGMMGSVFAGVGLHTLFRRG